MRTTPTILGPRRGQALLLVVLLMMAVILVGILFAALVSFNQEQGTRSSDLVRATALAEAGLRYAELMLTSSPQAADWRPPFKPYDPVSYDPSPATSDTWPVPPVWFSTGSASPNALGPDGKAFTDDDYYMDEEVKHGWAPLINLNPSAGAPGPTKSYYAHYGFSRYPDPTNAGQRGEPGNAGPLGGALAGLGLDQNDLNQGHFLLRISYSPNPPYSGAEIAANGNSLVGLKPDPLSRYIKIESIGVSAGTTFVWRSMVAYKAIGLTDHLLWVTDKENTGKPAVLGFGPWVDMDNDNTLTNLADASHLNNPNLPVDQRGDFLVTRYEGPMRFNSSLDLRGDNAAPPPASGSIKDERFGGTQVNLITQPLDYSDPLAWRPRGGGYNRDDKFESQHQIDETSTTQDKAAPPNTIPAQSTTVNLLSSWTASTSHTVWPSGLTTDATATPHFSTYNGRVLDNVQGFDTDGSSRYVDPLVAPDLFQTDPATGTNRYYALTRDSGPVAHNTTSGLTANVGRYGHGPGIYVDNFSDLQFVKNDTSHDNDALLDDLLGNLAATDPRASDSGWNAVRTVYAPKGMEVTLYRSEDQLAQAEGITDPAQIITVQNPGPLQPGQIWWPGHVTGGTTATLGQGEPGIKLTRHDGRWKVADPTTLDGTDLADDSGTNVMFVDYPKPGHQVIFAEGNIRISGQLPPDMTGTGRYDLSVVSGGTIYIDGQILSPQDVQFSDHLLLADGTVKNEIADLNLDLGKGPGVSAAGGRFTETKTTGLRDENNSYIALLAHDCVVLNPTQLVPALTQGLVTAQPDDPANPLTSGKHWTLFPTLGGSIFSRWTWGEPAQTPVAGTATDDPLSLAAYQTGADPGPAAITLRLWNSVNGYPGANNGFYDFDPAGTGQLKFLFTPTGMMPPNAWIAEALSPNWAALLNTPNPTVPWLLNGAANYLSPATAPGALNSLQLRYANPGVGTNATDYWLKRFKIEELDPNNDLPKGALHAKINALMYAQEGCFFIIPGQYFDYNASGDAAARFRRYNYDLEIRGAIAENFHAPSAAWQAWQDRWAYPQYFTSGGNTYLAWGTVNYHYDETLLATRAQAQTTLDTTGGQITRYASDALADPGVNLPKLPLLPTCPGLIYRGTG